MSIGADRRGGRVARAALAEVTEGGRLQREGYIASYSDQDNAPLMVAVLLGQASCDR